VAATSATSAWAVGYFSNGTADQTLIAHWNGKAWMQVPSPNPGSSSNRLTGVAAISAADVWAVGSYNSGAADQTMVANWNGKAWTRPPSPDPGGSTSGNDLFGVAATSSTNIWAVGGTGSQTLALHCC
jgi:hypothetical protein